jgi:hypothetical protein
MRLLRKENLGANKMILHIVRMVAITILITLCVVYPFIPGQYDSLAIPLSTMTQAGVAIGLLLVPIGILWLAYEIRKQAQGKQSREIDPRRYHFVLASMIALSIVAIAVSLVAFATVGFSLAFIMLTFWFYVLARLLTRLKSLKNVESSNFSPAPLYLVLIPVATTLLQFTLAAPIMNFSRDYAIANSRAFISDIEEYYAQYGRYPISLLAMWKDYYPNVVGIEKFHYAPSDNAYNLFFEQPRLLFDNIGTREWVLYNPRDEHHMFSHTSWFLLLTPEELERSQGWYAAHNTSHPHWRYFWFD